MAKDNIIPIKEEDIPFQFNSDTTQYKIVEYSSRFEIRTLRTISCLCFWCSIGLNFLNHKRINVWKFRDNARNLEEAKEKIASWRKTQAILNEKPIKEYLL